jgi:hypothetical protein
MLDMGFVYVGNEMDYFFVDEYLCNFNLNHWLGLSFPQLIIDNFLSCILKMFERIPL